MTYYTKVVRITILILVAVVLSVGSASVYAQATPEISYQGKLADSAGVPVADATYEIHFRLYTASSGGSAIWSEVENITTSDGLFSHMLGSSSTLSGVAFDQPLYLSIEVAGDGEMTPRKVLGTVPAAFEAENAQTLDNLATTSFLRSDQVDTATSLLTFSGGLRSTASSTITNLTTSIATTTTLVINNQAFTDLLGTGLINTAGTLTLDTTTLDTRYATTTAFDTESELESLLGDVTNIFTNNDTIGDANIADTITASNYLPLTGGTLSGTLSFSGTAANIALGSNYLSGDGDDEGIFVDADGKVGIGTSTPSSNLTVDGDVRITGALYDSSNLAGTDGYVLQTTGVGTAWVSTSSLGISGGGSSVTFGSNNQIPFSNSGGDDFDYSANLTFDGSNLSLGAAQGLAIDGGRVFYASSSLRSVAIGPESAFNLTSGSSENVALGWRALDAATSSALYNTAVGSRALSSVTTGNYNVALGRGAGEGITTGGSNIALGSDTLESVTVSNYNVGIGRQALADLTVGENNMAIGYQAGQFGTSTTNTVAMGYRALRYGNWTETVAIGSSVGLGVPGQSSERGVFIGSGAASSITSGSGNVLIGYRAGDSLTSGSYNVVIGHDVEAPSSTADNQLNIGNLIFGTGLDGLGTNLSSGNIGIATTTPSSRLTVAGSVQFATLTGGLLITDAEGKLSTTSVSASDLADGDFGDFTVSGGVATLDTNTVADSEIDYTAVTLSDFTDDVGYLTDITGSSFLDLSDTPGSFTNTRLLYMNGSAVTSDADLTFDGSQLTLGGTGLSLSGSTANIALGSNYLSGDGDDEGVFVNGIGNVGIGTTTPSAKLYVSGGSVTIDNNYSYGFKTSSGANRSMILLETDDNLRFGNTGAGDGNDSVSFNVTGNADVMVINSSGNVGIGTTLPNSKLTVAGDINITDTTSQLGGLDLNGLPLATGSSTLNNYFFGNASSISFTSGATYNYAVGEGALANLTTGDHNVALGINALSGSSTAGMTGGSNNALGGFSLSANTTGSSNNAFGPSSLSANTTGFYNNAFGHGSLLSNNGTGTIAIGYRAADNAVSVDRGIFIGYDIEAFSTTEDDVLNIGNLIFGTGLDGTGTTISSGNIGIGTTTPNSKLTVAGTFSASDGTAGNEIYGRGAYSNGAASSTIIGNGARVTAGSAFANHVVIGEAASSGGFSNNTVIGVGASIGSGGGSVALGASASGGSGGEAVAIGYDADATGNAGGIAIGGQVGVSDTGIAVGYGITAEDDQIVFGNRMQDNRSPDLYIRGAADQYVEQDLFSVNTAWLDAADSTRRSQALLRVYNATSSYTFLQADATTSGVETYFTGGNVGIGTTTPQSELQVIGDIRVGTSGSNGCVEDFGGGVIGGSCSSDERLKRNVVDLTAASEDILENLVALTPVTYNWNEVANQAFNKSTETTNIGLIAQDVEEYFPELVVNGEGGYKQIKFSSLQFYIIQALKEMWAVVTGNRERIETLEDENDVLKDRLEALEAALDVDSPADSANQPADSGSNDGGDTGTTTDPVVDAADDMSDSDDSATTSDDGTTDESEETATTTNDVSATGTETTSDSDATNASGGETEPNGVDEEEDDTPTDSTNQPTDPESNEASEDDVDETAAASESGAAGSDDADDANTEDEADEPEEETASDASGNDENN